MEPIALVGGMLIDGVSEEPTRNGAILIKDGYIKRVSRRARAPRGCHKVDASGQTILPGLIDAHVHLCLNGEANYEELVLKEPLALMAIKAAVYAQRLLRAGFTTVRDMGAPGLLAISLRRAIEKGLIAGPRIVAAGQIITSTGGHADFIPFGLWKEGDGLGRIADGPAEILRAVREQLKAGADCIKFCATGGVLDPQTEPGLQEYSEEEMRVLIAEAHKAGKRVAAHAQGTEGIKAALRAGVDTIEHGIFLDEEAVSLMVERGVYFVPTLSAPYNLLRHGKRAELPQYAIRKAEEVKEAHIRSLRMALEAGVRIAAGTDAGTPFNYHGDNALELELLVANGMTPMAAIQAATCRAAEALGLGERVGSIEQGKLADILVVQGDPLEDISLLRQRERISLVLKGGLPVGGTADGR